AHMICGCTRAKYVTCANPQSVLAMTFSRPTSRASRTMRSATSSGCSTMLVGWLITPGMSTVSLGSLRCSHSRVPRIGKLDGIAAGAHLQDEIGDVLEGNVGAVRSRPAAPADVVSDLLARKPFDGVVDDLDLAREPAAVLFERLGRHHPIIAHGRARIVQLHQQPGLDDPLVFRVQRLDHRLPHIVYSRA